MVTQNYVTMTTDHVVHESFKTNKINFTLNKCLPYHTKFAPDAI